MQEKENILRILKETKIAIERNDSIQLKELSNQTIHTSSIHQDADNIIIAVVVYSLSKLIERKSYHSHPGWNKFMQKTIANLNTAMDFLKKDNFGGYNKSIEILTSDIEKLSGDLREKIQDVFRKARINKASRIYEHGISMTKTAKLLGISLWELAEYAGQRPIGDMKYNLTINEKTRIKNALDIFK